MEIICKRRDIGAEIIIKSDNTIITEDVADRSGEIDKRLIQDIITVANDLSRHNKVSDVDFVYQIYEAFLNHTERKELQALLSK